MTSIIGCFLAKDSTAVIYPFKTITDQESIGMRVSPGCQTAQLLSLAASSLTAFLPFGQLGACCVEFGDSPYMLRGAKSRAVPE